jgi:hypothetical protein
MLVCCEHGSFRRRERRISKGANADAISCGMRSCSQDTVDPHSEQKWKITSFPVNELRVKVFEAPSTTVTALRSKQAAMLNKLPVRRWQSRQSHIETRVVLLSN